MEQLKKGDRPLSSRQMLKRHQNIVRRDWAQWRIERSVRTQDGEFDQYINNFSAFVDEDRRINSFNEELAAYKSAVARLSRYPLRDGRPQLTETHYRYEPLEEPVDGEFEREVAYEVEVQSYIAPFEPATVEETVYDEEGNAVETRTVTHPTLVKDEEERARAQTTVDETRTEVKEFYDNSLSQ